MATLKDMANGGTNNGRYKGSKGLINEWKAGRLRFCDFETEVLDLAFETSRRNQRFVTRAG